MDSTVLAALIGGTATLVAAGVGYAALRWSKASVAGVEVRALPDREAAFRTARSLVEEAKRSVIDTTWGSSEENLRQVERQALQKYLDAKDSAIEKSGVDYREIYTQGTDLERSKRIEIERSRTAPKYSAKLLDGLSPTFPMIDFLVADERRILLSCLSRDTAQAGKHFLYVESDDLGAFLTHYFQICWDQARDLHAPRKSAADA